MGTISLGCPHCSHEKSLFEAVWCGSLEGKYQTYLLCTHCGKGVGGILDPRIGLDPVQYRGDLDQYFTLEEWWPDPEELSAPAHTPEAVVKRFLEGEDNFRRHKWNSAVAMYRSALDIATKGLPGVPKGQTFYARLQWLNDQHRITKDMRDWADHVRIEGNEALHDPDEFIEKDATPLRHFTTMFLRYVFELPKMVEEYSAASKAKRGKI